MNERIKKLAQENGLDWAIKRAQLTGQTDDLDALDKFAKAIVAECADQVKSVYKQGGGTYSEAILSHFGQGYSNGRKRNTKPRAS
jgi:hypothetical protein